MTEEEGMGKTRRQMIQVDKEKCDGCGQCIPACPEGALQIVNGKARLVRESYCDGLGACLGDCPNGALHVLEVDAVEAYDEAGVIRHLQQTAPQMLEQHMTHLAAHPEVRQPQTQTPVIQLGEAGSGFAGCPGVEIQFRSPEQVAPVPDARPARAGSEAPLRVPSELRQWPVQLALLPVRAPFFHEADLTLVADCVPFACPNFHADVLRGTAVAVSCPKLDEAAHSGAYIQKLAQILQGNDIRKLRVVYMEVPCCRGLVWMAEQARALSGRDIPLETELVGIGL
jgi:ferredoxin